jgi:hypothetical protein
MHIYRYVYSYIYISFREENIDTRIENLGLNIDRYRDCKPVPLKVLDNDDVYLNRIQIYNGNQINF